MTVEWILLGIGIGLFAISCVGPFIARHYSNDALARGMIASLDAGLTIASVALCLVAIHPFWAALLIVGAFHIFASKVYFDIVEDAINPYTLKPYRKQEER